MPVSIRNNSFQPSGEFKVVTDAAEFVGFGIGVGLANEFKGVDPGAKGVAGEGGEKALFSAVGVSHEGTITEVFLQGGVKL